MNRNSSRPLSTRREFVGRSLALLSVAPTIPSFIDQTIWAMANPLDMPRTQQPSGKDGKIFVVVQLSGGNDGLNTVVPYGDDAYFKARGALAHDKNAVLKLDNYVGLAPNLKAFKSLYDDGRLSVIQGVGYPNPNRSHFRSMDIWHSAMPEKEVFTSGWLGRYFDNTCAGCDPHVGVAMGDTLPAAMRGDRVLPLSFERPESYRFQGKDKKNYLKLNVREDAALPPPPSTRPAIAAGKKAVSPVTPGSQLDFLHRTAMDAQVSSDDILRMTGRNPSVSYPANEFGNSLKTVASMIAGGLPTRVYYVSLGGFDTHAGQKGRHDNLMQTLSAGLEAFWADLKDQRNDDRVMLMTFSEFGRRVETNASGGTDHGAASSMFLMGPKLKTGLAGKYPSLTQLDQGDLKWNTDFRSVYATILEKWLDTPSKPILGNQFPTMPLLKV
jgi:uncharacterized protein (DUF1501 family)